MTRFQEKTLGTGSLMNFPDGQYFTHVVKLTAEAMSAFCETPLEEDSGKPEPGFPTLPHEPPPSADFAVSFCCNKSQPN